VNRWMRWSSPALLVAVVVAVLVVACGEMPSGSEAAQGTGVARVASPQTTTTLTEARVCPDGQVCVPTGAHAKHADKGYDCKVCHAYGGWLAFQNPGPAYLPNSTGTSKAPSFDATAKTCSNVACHSVPAGTFSYYFQGGDGEPVLNTVPYGGSTSTTPTNWYATGLGCGACHDNPASAPGGGKYNWHSGYHGGQGPAGARNQCQFCHPDATGSNGVGTSITNPALHGNGVVNVQASFTSSCFGCH
jgi:hypothetical protein